MSGFHPLAQCTVRGLKYDFDHRVGLLVIAADECCDMNGAIAIFTAIDVGVRCILTVAGDKLDTSYRRLDDGSWRAGVAPREVAPFTHRRPH